MDHHRQTNATLAAWLGHNLNKQGLDDIMNKDPIYKDSKKAQARSKRQFDDSIDYDKQWQGLIKHIGTLR